MRNIEITLYKFEELSEEVKGKVLKEFDDINVDSNWWEYIYGDAEENAKLKITSFDTDYHNIFPPIRIYINIIKFF